MVGSILSVRGKQFDVDSFLETSPWRVPARKYHKGEKSVVKGQPAIPLSGFQIDITGPDHNLDAQIQATVLFFENYDSELQRLKNFSGVEEIDLTVGSWWYSHTAAKIVTLPQKLVALVAKYGIEINVGVFATTDDRQQTVN